MPTPVEKPRRAVLALACAAGLLTAACSPEVPDSTPRAAASIAGGRLVVAGARPQFPAGAALVTDGFFEDVRWDAGRAQLQFKGWAPLDVRPREVRFVLRDPFDQLQVAGSPVFALLDRPDVAAAHPGQPALLHAGFAATVPLKNIPAGSVWPETLELYCLDELGDFIRLSRADAPQRQSWDRQRDRFEVALTYRHPDLLAPDNKRGSLDLAEAAGEPHLVRLAGWADFDGRSPGSALIVELAPRLAPASIRSCVWVPRPDVRAAVAPDREDLDRCGFDLILQVAGSVDDLRERGAVRLWSINDRHETFEVGLAALRR